MRIEGPLGVCQLFETTILTLLNYASLVATNASRYRVAAGFDKQLLEFGLRRAQGPDGGMSGSRFAFIGGFDSTSNVRASFLFGLPCKGTHAHAYITVFSCENYLFTGLSIFRVALDDLHTKVLARADGKNSPIEFADAVANLRAEAFATHPGREMFKSSHLGELTAFIAYAQAFPKAFLALVDTYDILMSGVPNYCFVAATLVRWGYRPSGIRIDSGDLSYFSRYDHHLRQISPSEWRENSLTNLENGTESI